MPLHIVLLVLVAAMLHATWNVIVKGGDNKLFESAMNSLGGALGVLCLAPFVSLPPTDTLWLLGLALLVHLLYYLCITSAYREADLSLCYPVMRGTAPMLTALVLCVAGAPLSPVGGAGVVVLCAGIVSLALEQKFSRHAGMRGIFLALRTSVCIMCYTLADGYGARATGNALTYIFWLHLLNAVPIHTLVLARHGRAYAAYLRRRWLFGLVSGLAGLGSYGIAVWAMCLAPIALVAALRETSVIFAMILAVFFLGERLTKARVFAVLLVLAGAMILRLG